jgi:hypothetical protein
MSETPPFCPECKSVPCATWCHVAALSADRKRIAGLLTAVVNEPPYWLSPALRPLRDALARGELPE